MGQRLNVELTYNGETIANAYYHWSAYTMSSAMLSAEIISSLDKIKGKAPLDLAVRALELTGAGVNEKEYERIRLDNTGKFSGIRFQNASNRNDGLISVTEEGIEETRRWEEGRVTINLDSETVNFSVYWDYAEEEYEDNFDGDFMDLPEYDFDFSEIPFAKFGDLEAIIDQYPDGFRNPEGYAIRWIE